MSLARIKKQEPAESMKCSQAGSCFFRLIGRSPTSSRSESEGEMSKAEQEGEAQHRAVAKAEAR